jgi:hypothetical protein
MKRPHRKSWTPEEDKRLLTLFEEGRSTMIVAAMLQRTVTAVKGRTSSLRISRRQKQAGTTPDVND